MSNYFKNFPAVPYLFGDEENGSLYQNLSVYVDVFDQVADGIALYSYYEIMDYDRPDTLSYKLYDTVDYHWTFFMMNQHLRYGGWPIALPQVMELSQRRFPNWTVTTEDEMYDNPLPGTVVTGSLSGTVGTVVSRNLDLGQMVIESPDNFTDGEVITYFDNTGQIQYIQLKQQSREYNGVHHYENTDGEWIDINPFDHSDLGLYTAVTNYERLMADNNAQRKIKIIDKGTVRQVVAEFHKAVRG